MSARAHAAAAAIAVATAFAIDRCWGEPSDRWHPVAWMGRALSAAGAPWTRASPAGAFARGALAWIVGAALCAAGAELLARVAQAAGQWAAGASFSGGWSAALRLAVESSLLGVLLKPLLAWRMLRDEVRAVGRALEHGLDGARRRLSRLVSRDTAALDAAVVCESAIESLAENLNDSLVAPLFWFALGGLPAAALYRFANTADAMWGYRGRFEWAGKWAARADDVLSYVPARITAALLAVALPARPCGLPREAARTPSPNSGWPMAMMALGLGVRLSKPAVYVLNAPGRRAGAPDIERAIAAASRAADAAVGLAALAWAVRAAAA